MAFLSSCHFLLFLLLPMTVGLGARGGREEAGDTPRSSPSSCSGLRGSEDDETCGGSVAVCARFFVCSRWFGSGFRKGKKRDFGTYKIGARNQPLHIHLTTWSVILPL